MLYAILLSIQLATVEVRLDSDHYLTRQSAERDCVRLWDLAPRVLDRLCESSSIEVRERAKRARCRAVDLALDALGEPPWCDWPLYQFDCAGWGLRFPEIYSDIHRELPRGIEDRYQGDYLAYRQLQRDRSRSDLLRGAPVWLVRIEWELARMVERDYRARRPSTSWFNQETNNE